MTPTERHRHMNKQAGILSLLRGLGGHLSNNKGTYGTLAGIYGGAHALGSATDEYDKHYDWTTDPLAKPLQGMAAVRRAVKDTATAATSPETKKAGETALAGIHNTLAPSAYSEWGDEYVRMPGTMVTVPKSMAVEGPLAALTAAGALLLARRSPAALKALERTMMVKGVNVNPKIGKLFVPAAASVAAGSVVDAGAAALGQPLRTNPDVSKAELENMEGRAGQFTEKRKEYKDMVDTANSRAYGYKPAVASAVAGTVGGIAGYMIPEKNKLLWSLAGGAAGSALPYLVEAIRQRTQAPMSKNSADLKPVDYGELWNKYKYDIGSGAALGGATGLGIGGYLMPKQRWWMLPGSAGLLGLSYYLARAGSQRRWDYAPMGGDQNYVQAEHPLMKDRVLYNTYAKLSDEYMPDVPRLGEKDMNDILWKREKFNSRSRDENWDKSRRVKENQNFIKSVIGPKIETSSMSEEDRGQFNFDRSVETLGRVFLLRRDFL